MSDERTDAIRTFLHQSGWQDAALMPLPGDASTRRYLRIMQGERKAMLMDQPQSAETPPCPPDASAEQRRALGYNAIARLAGADCARFVAAAAFLHAQGLSAPSVYAADPATGFVLMEDLGDRLFTDVLSAEGNEETLYSGAIDAIVRLHLEEAPADLAQGIPLHAYDETALLAEVDLMTEWFFPVVLGRAARTEETIQHRTLWRELLHVPLSDPRVFVHRDYHAHNLLWLPERKGLARVGVIDFQDAVAGTPSYDLVSLLEDARRDVPADLAEAMISRYLDSMRAQGVPLDVDRYRTEMAVMAAQRNVKIAGIFARLFKRDRKPHYLSYLPRVWSYLNRDLQHPALAQLRAWYNDAIPMESRGAPNIKGAMV
jgi:aminoglycoside/choline kinase family phosphotransferase